MLPVGCKHRQVGCTQRAALLYKSLKVGLCANLVGAQALGFVVYGASSVVGVVVYHPLQHTSHVVGVVNNGEDRLKLLVAGKLVVESVRSYRPFGLAYRHNVHTLVGLEVYAPLVLWHTRHDVVLAEGPVLSNARVLHPYISVLRVPLNVNLRVLYENRRVRLAVVVHYLPLVVHDVLYVDHRRQQFVRCSEVVELAAGQWQYRHSQVANLLVLNTRVGAKCATEGSVEVVVVNLALLDVAIGYRVAHKGAHGTVGQYPYADVGKVEVVGKQGGKGVG